MCSEFVHATAAPVSLLPFSLLPFSLLPFSLSLPPFFSCPSCPSLSSSPLFSLAFLLSLLPPAFLLQAPKAKKKVKASLGVGKAAKKVVDYQDYENDLGGEFDDFM